MLRKFSAIGMSRYTTQQTLDRLISDLLEKNQLRGKQFMKNGRSHVELTKDMGPFQLILRGEFTGKNSINIFMAIPSLKEKRGYEFFDCETEEDAGDLIYLTGQDKESLEGICLSVTEVYRFYREPGLKERKEHTVSCYGLSVEGKILLGIERTQEDEEAIHEGEAWRRELLSRAIEGDEEAMGQIEEEEDYTQWEIEERMKKEDVYSIFDGFMYPGNGGENGFSVLGEIRYVDKLMNSFTEEWVYYLELNVLGQILRVCINPRDLLGEPQPGRRFMGQVYFYGRLDPARLILENTGSFF